MLTKNFLDLFDFTTGSHSYVVQFEIPFVQYYSHVLLRKIMHQFFLITMNFLLFLTMFRMK